MNQNSQLDNLANTFQATMNQSESQIREFLKTLSDLDMYNVGLIGMNPDKSSMATIVDYLVSRLRHVQDLDRIVKSDFNIEGEHLPKDHNVQSRIREDYGYKVESMNKVLAFEPLAKVMSLAIQIENQTPQPTNEHQQKL